MTLKTGQISRTRFVAKKTARVAIATLSWPPMALKKLAHYRDQSIRVLTYHRFGKSDRDPFCLTSDCFEQQMSWLARHGRIVSLSMFLKHLRGERLLPPQSILITIDDGHSSVYSHAWPILRRYQVPAVVFVVGAYIGKGGYMNWSALRELQSEGIEIGSHGFQHFSMARLAPLAAAQEATRSRAVLEGELKQTIRAFAYPFGTRSDVNDATEKALRYAGYECGFTAQHGAVLSGAAVLRLPRIKVEAADPAWLFPCLCSGALDRYGWIDRHLHGLQQGHKAGFTRQPA